MMKNTTVIQQRRLDPLMEKASRVMSNYEKVSGCNTAVLDSDYSEKKLTALGVFPFCAVCKKQFACLPKKAGMDKYPCAGMHGKAINDSWRLGGSYSYMCDMGFAFWTNALYSGRCFAGALIAGGVLGVNQRDAIKKAVSLSGGKIKSSEIEQYFSGISEKKPEEIKALAQIMQVCAGQLSQSLEKPYPADAQLPNNDTDSTNMERMLLASLRRGDTVEAQKLLAELLLPAESTGNIEVLRARAIELTVMVSRAATGNDKNTYIQEEHFRYLNKITTAKDAREITDITNIIIERMSGLMFSFHGIRHSSALRKAERYIHENYTGKITLQKIANSAGLSAPYFSTVFREEMGENLSRYLNRMRVGKAAALLVETTMPVNKIASDCGFEDKSWFSKIFKNYTGFSPCKFREQRGIGENPVLSQPNV